MKTFLLTIVVLTTSLVCVGQAKKFTATLNPFSFLEPQAGFTPGIGYQINDRWAVYSDLGVIFYRAYQFSRNNNQKISGYKIKPAVRYFLEDQNTASKKASLFFDVEGLFKRTKDFETGELPISDNSGNLLYRYTGGWRSIRTIYGASIKIGYRFFLDEQKRFGADGYVGLGFRTGNQKNEGVPLGAPIGANGVKSSAFNEDFLPGGRAPSFPGGLKFFYIF